MQALMPDEPGPMHHFVAQSTVREQGDLGVIDVFKDVSRFFRQKRRQISLNHNRWDDVLKGSASPVS